MKKTAENLEKIQQDNKDYRQNEITVVNRQTQRKCSSLLSIWFQMDPFEYYNTGTMTELSAEFTGIGADFKDAQLRVQLGDLLIF